MNTAQVGRQTSQPTLSHQVTLEAHFTIVSPPRQYIVSCSSINDPQQHPRASYSGVNLRPLIVTSNLGSWEVVDMPKWRTCDYPGVVPVHDLAAQHGIPTAYRRHLRPNFGGEWHLEGREGYLPCTDYCTVHRALSVHHQLEPDTKVQCAALYSRG